MPGDHPISSRLKFRLAAFILAIGFAVALITWAAHGSWKRTGELRDKLTGIQFQSFQIADHIEQTILELNNLVLRYGVYQDTNDWAHFGSTSTNLDRWIDAQRPILSTEKEKLILDLINTNYDFYMAAARKLDDKVHSQTEPTIRLIEFADFEKQSQSISKLGFQLATAHRESMDTFLADSKKALNYLIVLLLISLALLLVAVGGLAVVVYGELIAPLQVRLVESQALAERHEKLASLGMLAAGLAHEIRNPLTAIKAWLFIQRKHLKPGTPEYDDAEIIGQEISRLERIVKDVLLFARPSEPDFTIVSADQPLREVQTLLGPGFEKSKIRLSFENSVSARIRIDPQQIKQALINLVQNAADSIGESGQITL